MNLKYIVIFILFTFCKVVIAMEDETSNEIEITLLTKSNTNNLYRETTSLIKKESISDQLTPISTSSREDCDILLDSDVPDTAVVEDLLNNSLTETDYLLKKIMFPEVMVPKNECLSKSNYILRGITLFFGATAGFPFIVFARSAVPSNEALGWALAVPTVLSLGASRSWAMTQVIPDLNILRSEAKFATKRELAIALTKHTSCHIFGFLSSLSFSLTVYKYNTIKPLAISTFISEYILGTYGYIEFVNKSNIFKELKMNFTQCRSEDDLLLHKSRSKALLAANNVVPNILSLDNLERSEIIRILFDNINNQQNGKTFIRTLVNLQKESNIGLHAYFRPVVKLLIYSIPLSNAFQGVMLAINSSRVFSSSPWFTAGYTFVTVTPSFVIGLLSTGETIDDMYNNIFGLRGESFLGAYYPKTRIAIVGLSLLNSVLATSGAMFLTYDTINNSVLKDFALYFTLMNGIGIIIFETYTMRYILEKLIHLYAANYGDDDQKKLLKIEDTAERLASSLPTINDQFYKQLLDDTTDHNPRNIPSLSEEAGYRCNCTLL